MQVLGPSRGNPKGPLEEGIQAPAGAMETTVEEAPRQAPFPKVVGDVVTAARTFPQEPGKELPLLPDILQESCRVPAACRG